MAFTETLTSDGASGEFIADMALAAIPTPGYFRVHLAGAFGGGTITLQQKINGVFEDLQGTAQTEASDYIFDSAAVTPEDYRFNVSGSTTPSIVVTASGAVSSST